MQPPSKATSLLFTRFIELLAPFSTLLYLTLSYTTSHRHFTPLLITTFLCWLYLTDDVYHLAQPVYVCYFPVEGKTHHHPQESRLRIQWKLYALASLSSFVAICFGFLEGRVFGRVGEMETQGGKSREEKGNVVFGTTLSDRELVKTSRRLKYRRAVLMVCAGVAGACGYLVLPAGRRYEGWWI